MRDTMPCMPLSCRRLSSLSDSSFASLNSSIHHVNKHGAYCKESHFLTLGSRSPLPHRLVNGNGLVNNALLESPRRGTLPPNIGPHRSQLMIALFARMAAGNHGPSRRRCPRVRSHEGVHAGQPRRTWHIAFEKRRECWH